MDDAEIQALVHGLDDEALADLVAGLPEPVIAGLLSKTAYQAQIPLTPLAHAREMDHAYRIRPHLQHLSDVLAQAVADVERGISRKVRVSMPPRSGKSEMVSVHLPVWLLRKHADWKIGLISHSPSLVTNWGGRVRDVIEETPSLGVSLAKDGGARGEWWTNARGGVVARSAPGQSVTGLGFKVLLIDDIVKDIASAHSKTARDAVWGWWLANSQTRLEPPSLVIVVGTRWHEDDFIGRLASTEYDGDPEEWTVVEFPAIAETADALGRAPGEPLLIPLLEETPEEALERWAGVKRSVGSYTWSALYQQRPAPASGAVFSMDWWRFWSSDPARATPDGKVIYLDPREMSQAKIGQFTWVESWDMTFKGGAEGDFVVGQRWARSGPDRFLIDQVRGRWDFSQTLKRFEAFAAPYVHTRLVEETANGPAIMSSLRGVVDGLTGIKPGAKGKEARAQAVTAEIESGNVYLPHPSEHPWVADLLEELRDFPHGAHDDQVDTLTQALARLRLASPSTAHSPARRPQRIGSRAMGGSLRG